MCWKCHLFLEVKQALLVTLALTQSVTRSSTQRWFWVFCVHQDTCQHWAFKLIDNAYIANKN